MSPPSEQIRVEASGAALPFSKGVLAQSFLATGMDPSAAWAIALEIEQRLLAAGTAGISRAALRDVAVGVLRGRGDAESAERYLLWRRYQEPDRPMILLLGGTSGVGKSALALEVARRLGIGRVQSTDSIREVMRILSSREQLPALFGSSYDAYRLLPRAGRAPTVLDGFLAQAELVSAGVRAAVDRSVAESTNLVIDGVSLVPGSLGLEVPDDRADVVFAVIAALDEDSLRDRFVVRAQGQRRRLASRYLENLDGILAIQRLLIELAAREGVPVVNNVLLEAAVQETIGIVMRALRRRSLPEAAAGREPT